MTKSEKKKMRGYREKDPSNRAELYYSDLSGRLGVAEAVTVDHFADGYMFPVKDQGNCGSCYAFAANSALEGYVARKYDRAPVHYSE